MTGWTVGATRRLDELRGARLLRSITDFDASGPVGRLPDGSLVVSFAGNDYLGLSTHPLVRAAAHAALDTWGTGSGSARLLAGSRPVHSELEQEIAAWKHTDAAVLFATGFAANVGVLSTLGGPGTLICSDELNHASIVEGCRSSKGRVEVYPHGDVGAVAELLAGADRAIVVSDAVFSMDGDVGPLTELAGLCSHHGALLVIDEAHAVLSGAIDLCGAETLRVGTLSKFLGAMGGYVAGPRPLIEVLVNAARSFIFTTASPPADAAAALAALRILRAAEGERLRDRLRALVERFAPGHLSPIVPIVLGDEERALRAADELRHRGFLVPAIRPPSVPRGRSRLRVTLSAAHTNHHVDALSEALASLRLSAHA